MDCRFSPSRPPAGGLQEASRRRVGPELAHGLGALDPKGIDPEIARRPRLGWRQDDRAPRADDPGAATMTKEQL